MIDEIIIAYALPFSKEYLCVILFEFEDSFLKRALMREEKEDGRNKLLNPKE